MKSTVSRSWSLRSRFFGGIAVSLGLVGIAEGTLRIIGFSYVPEETPLVLYTRKQDALMVPGFKLEPSRTMLWQNVPGVGAHNEQGFRGEPLPPVRGPDHLRVV